MMKNYIKIRQLNSFPSASGCGDRLHFLNITMINNVDAMKAKVDV